MVLPELFHVIEHGPVIRPSHAVELHGLQVPVKLLLGSDLHVLLDRRVTLDDPGEEGLLLLEDVVGLLHEALHQLSPDGAGGVDGNDELPDALDLFILQWLDQGHVPEELHAVGVVDIVKLVDDHTLPHDGKLPQEGAVVVFFPIDLPEILQQAPSLLPKLE